MDRVTKHQDYSGKYCPHRTLDLGWTRFRNLVQKYYNELKGGSPTGGESSTQTQGGKKDLMERGDAFLISYTDTSDMELVRKALDGYFFQSDKAKDSGQAIITKSGHFDYSGLSDHSMINIGGKGVSLSSFSKIPEHQFFVMDEEDLAVLLSGQSNWGKIKRRFKSGKIVEDGYKK